MAERPREASRQSEGVGPQALGYVRGRGGDGRSARVAGVAELDAFDDIGGGFEAAPFVEEAGVAGLLQERDVRHEFALRGREFGGWRRVAAPGGELGAGRSRLAGGAGDGRHVDGVAGALEAGPEGLVEVAPVAEGVEVALPVTV